MTFEISNAIFQNHKNILYKDSYIVLRFRNEIQAVCAILILTKCLSTIAEAADFNLKNKPENRDRGAVADSFRPSHF